MRKLESLEAWKLGGVVAREVYRMTLKPPLDRHYAVSDQIRRAALSVPANVTEGYALGTRLQLIRCLRIALASAAELKGHLEVIRDIDLLRGDAMDQAISDANREVALLIGLLKRLGAGVPKGREGGRGKGEA